MALRTRAVFGIAVLAVFACVALLEIAHGSVNDHPPKRLWYFCDHAFTGAVVDIESKDVPNTHHPEWSNRHFRLTVNITSVKKTVKHAKVNPDADDETVPEPPGQVHVMMWQAYGRPEGWVGPRGVRRLPVVGEELGFFALYLHRDPQRRSMYHASFPHEDDADRPLKAYNVLTPNGIEPVDVLVAIANPPSEEL